MPRSVEVRPGTRPGLSVGRNEEIRGAFKDANHVTITDLVPPQALAWLSSTLLPTALAKAPAVRCSCTYGQVLTLKPLRAAAARPFPTPFVPYPLRRPSQVHLSTSLGGPWRLAGCSASCTAPNQVSTRPNPPAHLQPPCMPVAGRTCQARSCIARPHRRTGADASGPYLRVRCDPAAAAEAATVSASRCCSWPHRQRRCRRLQVAGMRAPTHAPWLPQCSA